MIVGYAYVVGDLLHRGHILHLNNCKALCDKLVVGVLTDEATMEKKPKPTLSFDERILIVRNLKCVDVAVAQAKYNPTENCEIIQPDILFENPQHQPKGRNYGRKTIILPYYPVQSSTLIKEKVKREKK